MLPYVLLGLTVLMLAGLAAVMIVQVGKIRRQVEAARERLNAIQAMKSEEQTALMTTIATGLAHEVRNPLSSLRMNLQLLKEDWESPVTEREKKNVKKLETLLRETDRIQEVVDTFLKFAAGHRLRMEPVDLNQLLDELTEFLSAQAEKEKIRFNKELASDLPRVQADANLIRQAVMNLLINAEQAMPEGGVITIRTESADSRVRLTVRDDGEGIDPGIRNRVFDIYFSTKPAGTGLGLPITRKIILEHRGTIEIDSEAGKGTTVTIELPT